LYMMLMGAVGLTMVAVVTSALSTGAGDELTTLRRNLRRTQRARTGVGAGSGGAEGLIPFAARRG
jgi:hypothetical protein